MYMTRVKCTYTVRYIHITVSLTVSSIYSNYILRSSIHI